MILTQLFPSLKLDRMKGDVDRKVKKNIKISNEML